ncbi:phosphopyruvate hydratase [Candidatus Neoehrlichia procyonis]|uniref:Enolase n=1 Tax=Candidatus Neoehrlichia procyonis str. RAC413 TaxID=1359163 RepID=A0A0F3NM79_9RICK|nr:phosphopyruvate hydratase [Candidatus Neoehrlichia lotoris]KJV68886.1 phosphopyruvate hydratase [Candidatus Neoehrlichia lotoris str. RAC413]
MVTITKIFAREILDSRGYPTVEVEVMLSNGAVGRSSVPSGASVGKFEATELRDGNPNYYCGYGVTKSVDIINSEITNHILQMNAFSQEDIDKLLIKIDGTSNKSRIGANSTIGVSIAIANAAAASLNIPLYQYLGGKIAKTMPIPLINVINGGLHADNNLDFQEFMIIPSGAAKFKEAVKMSAEVFYNLKKILRKKNYNTNVGDEGGFAPNIKTNAEVFDIMIDSIEKSGYKLYQDFTLGLDIAASTFYNNNAYNFANHTSTSQELISYYKDVITQYPITSIEDAMAENDIEGWQNITKELGDKVQLVGDDLFVTNCNLIKNGIKKNMANAVLVKPNQIGTLTETLNAIALAQKYNYNVIISHRSGETEDVAIAHIAVATNCGQIKIGSLSRSERLAKYNELLRIEEHLGTSSIYNYQI